MLIKFSTTIDIHIKEMLKYKCVHEDYDRRIVKLKRNKDFQQTNFYY